MSESRTETAPAPDPNGATINRIGDILATGSTGKWFGEHAIAPAVRAKVTDTQDGHVYTFRLAGIITADTILAAAVLAEAQPEAVKWSRDKAVIGPVQLVREAKTAPVLLAQLLYRLAEKFDAK